MFLITRYLIKNLLIVTVFILLVLMSVIWLTQSMRLLELVADSDAPPSLLLKLLVLSSPRFLEIILPLSLVSAVVFTYNRLLQDNELIVMRAAGMDPMALSRGALILATCVTLVLLVFTTVIAPRSTEQLIFLRETAKSKYSVFFLREGVFNSFSDDFTVYMRKRDGVGDLYGLMIHDIRDKTRPPVIITAKRGQVLFQNGVPKIIVYDGQRHQKDVETQSLSKLLFSKYTIEIENMQEGGFIHWRDAAERTMSELYWPDTSDYRVAIREKAFLAEFYNRLISPLHALMFTVCALCILLRGSWSRRGQRKKIFATIAVVSVLQIATLFLGNLSQTHFEAIYGLCTVILLPLFFGLALLQGREQPIQKPAIAMEDSGP